MGNTEYEQNFGGVRAYATTLQGAAFLGDEEAISKGIEPHHDDSNTVYMGRVESEGDGNIKLKKAVNISPSQLKNIQQCPNYEVSEPADVLRDLLYKVKNLYPQLLSEQETLDESIVQAELDLAKR